MIKNLEEKLVETNAALSAAKGMNVLLLHQNDEMKKQIICKDMAIQELEVELGQQIQETVA